jgi:hypothetical protein
MFQYASVKGLASHFNLKFKVLSRLVSHDHHTPTYEMFDQGMLGIDDVPLSAYDNASQTGVETWCQPASEHIGCHPMNKEVITDKLVVGYFQSERYFAHIADEIRREFKVPSSVKEVIEHYLTQLHIPLEHNNACVIHFRFGDILVKREQHFIDLTEYYTHCITKVASDAPIIIVTEQPECIYTIYPSVFALLKQRSSPVYIAPTDVATCEFFHMYLMTYAKTVIAANSTFSWWGAWLNERADKQVFIPSRLINWSPHRIDMEGATFIEV